MVSLGRLSMAKFLAKFLDALEKQKDASRSLKSAPARA
jgi:hypothetical protein